MKANFHGDLRIRLTVVVVVIVVYAASCVIQNLKQ